VPSGGRVPSLGVEFMRAKLGTVADGLVEV
jgi:hypothetical protein